MPSVRGYERGVSGPHGETETHQLPGAACSLPSTEELSTEQEVIEHPPMDRQCDSNCFSEQNGWHSFSGTLRSSSGNLGMVFREGDHSPRRTPPRQGQRVTTHVGLQRLDARESHLPPATVQVGPILHRPICITDECTAPCVLQLAPRPSSSSCGCLVHTLGESPCIHVPTIRPNHTLLGEASIGASECSANCCSLAQSALVPFSPQSPSGLPNPAASSAGHSNQSRGPEPPTGAPRPSSSGRLAHLRRSFRSDGLSEGVIELIRKSWQASTESAYSSACHQWNSWCLRRGVDPLSAPLSHILEFLQTQFQAGKQYRTINTLRSAISMTHMEVDEVRVGQHPLVSRLLKGVLTTGHQPLNTLAPGM